MRVPACLRKVGSGDMNNSTAAPVPTHPTTAPSVLLLAGATVGEAVLFPLGAMLGAAVELPIGARLVGAGDTQGCLSSGTELLSDGSEMSLLLVGADPSVQEQHGSPSS